MYIYIYGTYPSENMSFSVRVIIPDIWTNNPNVPNHQADENYPTKIVDIFMFLHVSSHCITFGIHILINHIFGCLKIPWIILMGR